MGRITRFFQLKWQNCISSLRWQIQTCTSPSFHFPEFWKCSFQLSHNSVSHLQPQNLCPRSLIFAIYNKQSVFLELALFITKHFPSFRSVFLEYEKDVVVQGIPALRFVTPERLFASPLHNPDNMCYCTEEQYCELSGILDVSPCRKGKVVSLNLHGVENFVFCRMFWLFCILQMLNFLKA